jgi:hypothetical protein
LLVGLLTVVALGADGATAKKPCTGPVAIQPKDTCAKTFRAAPTMREWRSPTTCRGCWGVFLDVRAVNGKRMTDIPSGHQCHSEYWRHGLRVYVNHCHNRLVVRYKVLAPGASRFRLTYQFLD